MDYLRNILITGHPRSGTGYCAKLLQLNGLDVKHEEMGESGTSSWLFAVPAVGLPFTFDDSEPTNYVFKHRLQVVRDPIKCVSSVYYTEFGSLEWRKRFMLLEGNEIQQAVQSVICWNNIIKQSANLSFKLERPEVMLEYLKTNGLVDNFELLPEIVNAREHEELSIKQIRDNIQPALFAKFLNFIEWYEQL